MCSKHDDMSVFKIPGQFDRLTDRKKPPGPELAEGRPVALLSSSRMRGSILVLYYCLQAHPLCWVGLHYLSSFKNKSPMERSPWAFTFTLLFLFLPPTPNPLINALKPTHCAGWGRLLTSTTVI